MRRRCLLKNEESIVVAKLNVTTTSSPTRIASATTSFKSIEIDGNSVSVGTWYTFDTLGEHTVKYTLKKPPTVAYRTFYGCSSLTSIDIPNSVTSIGNEAFTNCTSLSSCTFEEGSQLTSIGNYVFQGCISLTSIDIPNTVTSIGQYAFSNCSGLTSCTFEEGSQLTSIGERAFQQCISLTSIDIPSGVTSISTSAFRYCSSLTSIACNATTAPTISSNTFRDVKSNGTLTVPSGSSGYDVWMGTGNYYLGKYGWTKVEQ